MHKFTRTVSFGNGFGIEFTVLDANTIEFSVFVEKDPTLVSTEKLCIGTDASTRVVEVDENTGDVIPSSVEIMRDFASRARSEGIEFAEATIAEHKEILDLSGVLSDVLESFGGENPTTKH